MRVVAIFILLITILLFSCTDDKETIVPNLGYNYAGIEEGKFVIYDVVSIFYDDFNGTIDTSVFQIREEINAQFIDLEGEESFIIHRSMRENSDFDWVLTDSWSAKLTGTTLEKAEDNVRFVKMIFPLSGNKTWNGNSMNNLGEMDYEYNSIHQQ